LASSKHGENVDISSLDDLVF